MLPSRTPRRLKKQTEGTTVMKYNGTAWTYVGLPGFSAGGANYTVIAIDSNGNPYVAYQDVGNSNKLTAMVYR